MSIVSELLEIDSDLLRKWLCNRKIETVNEEIVKPMTIVDSNYSRDALSKLLYSCLFNHIVEKINETLSQNSADRHGFIGVLDIYGFETFEQNSFEQFCINYANEKLQQQFNLHVFKLEQEEYVKEGIEWTFIDFYDNQPCIDLIEAKMGILDLLDEECRMPQGDDKSWLLKLNQHCAAYDHYVAPKRRGVSFVVKHFADEVDYTVDGFLQKNRDAVNQELVTVVRHSKVSKFCFIWKIFVFLIMQCN